MSFVPIVVFVGISRERMKPLYGLFWLMPLENLCILFPSSFCVFINSQLVAAIELSASVSEFVVSLKESALKAVHLVEHFSTLTSWRQMCKVLELFLYLAPSKI